MTAARTGAAQKALELEMIYLQYSANGSLHRRDGPSEVIFSTLQQEAEISEKHFSPAGSLEPSWEVW